MLIIVILLMLAATLLHAQSVWTSLRTPLPDAFSVPNVEFPLTCLDLPDSSLDLAVAPLSYGLPSVWQGTSVFTIGGFPVGLTSSHVGAWTEFGAGVVLSDTIQDDLHAAMAPSIQAGGARGFSWSATIRLHAGLQWKLNDITTLGLTVQNTTLIRWAGQRPVPPLIRFAGAWAFNDWDFHAGISMIAGFGLSVTAIASTAVHPHVLLLGGLETLPGSLRAGIALQVPHPCSLVLDYLVGIGFRPMVLTRISL